MSADPPCSVCGHPITLSRCWRLTCPTNGARESFKVARRGDQPAPAEQGKML
jgi:hypothetical protein